MVSDRRWAAGVLSLMTLAAGHAIQQPSLADQHPSADQQQPSAAQQQPSAADQQPSAADQQPSAADQLSALLGPVVEGAVSRALAGQHQCGADAGRRALGRLEERLDAVIRDVAALQTALASIQDATTAHSGACRLRQAEPEPEPEPEPETEPACEVQPEPKPACEERPAPLPVVVAVPHQEPARRACARSCLQLRDQGGALQDGVYWLTGLPVPVLCDFSHDDGGWTLLLTATSKNGWDLASVMRRNERSPSLTDNYSILRYADAIRDLGNGSRFAYRIEAQAQTGRQRWGGMWLAPRRYSFVDETGSQTDVRLVRRFDRWAYQDKGIEKRMPWLRGGEDTVLTTSDVAGRHWWGTLVTSRRHPADFWQHAPWIEGGSAHSGTVLYWVREEEL